MIHTASVAVADQAVQVVVNGATRSPINIKTAAATGGGRASVLQHDPPGARGSGVPAWIKGPWSFAVGAAAIAAVYVAVALEKNVWPF